MYLGRGIPAAVHAHHAVQVCIPLRGSIRLRGSARMAWREYEAAVIPSGQSHESDVAVDSLATIWLEPAAPEARTLVGAAASGRAIIGFERARVAALLADLRSCLTEGWAPVRARELLERVLRAVAPAATRTVRADRRVAHVRRTIDAQSDRRHSVAELAAGVALSPSRLQHLFSAEVGIPIRRYALWCRLRWATWELARGSSVTRAAHAAGFADAAHLSRTFRRTIGFTPSALLHLKVSRFVQASKPVMR